MFKSTLVAFMLFISSVCLANEKELANETTVFDETFNWQMQMGFSLVHASSILDGVEQSNFVQHLNISLLLDLYYKGFFIQSNHRRSDTHTLGAELGYQIIVEDNWQLDILTKSYISGINAEDIMDIQDEHIPILDGLKKRDSGDGLALRYTRNFTHSYMSFDLATLAPLSDAKGWLAEMFYSKLMPYRNWDIHINASLTYYSQDVIDYYVGIGANETSEIRPEHSADNSFKGQVEVFFQHPISESWTFNAGLSQSFYTGGIDDSPIVDQNNSTHVMMGVLYVF